MSREEEARRFFAYETCPSDRRAAAFLGIGYDAFRMWRVRRDLPTIPSVCRDAVAWPLPKFLPRAVLEAGRRRASPRRGLLS